MIASPLAPPVPPRVYVHGYAHLDVVRHACGWTGTVHHDRRALGAARVRWHGSFAEDDLGDVAPQLRLVARRGTPKPPTAPKPTRVEPQRVNAAVALAHKIDGWATKIDKFLGRS